VYRDATPDIDPEVRSGAHIEADVLGTVRRVDPSTGAAYDCYVLHTRQVGGPDVVSYLHQASDGVDLYGVEIAQYTGAPELVQVNGEPYMQLPLHQGSSWGFSKPYGGSLRAKVLAQESVPLSAAQRELLHPYAEGATRAWRVEWQYEGVLNDAYGPGIVDTWLVPGAGVVGRSARSRYYELAEFRAREDVIQLPGDFRDAAYPHSNEQDVGDYDRTPSPGQVIAVQFRGEDSSAPSGWQWEIEETCWRRLMSEGVLSPLWPGDQGGTFLSDFRGTQKLHTGSYVFLFEVRTAGSTELRFRRVGVGASAGLADAFVYTFGEKQPISLSSGSATHLETNDGAIVTFKVHYQDGDGVEPSVRQVVVYRRSETPAEGMTYDMTFASGKLADGDYVYTTGPNELLPLRTDYWYSFHFENVENGDTESEDLGPHPLYIGGTSP
jgi:hypothetical protein